MNPILVCTSIAAIFVACLLGSTTMEFGRVISALSFSGPVGDQIVIWEIRLPRAVAAYIVGAALGMSGAGLQGLLRNPLAEPGVLGVSACAALGATCALYFGLVALWPYALPVAAITGAVVATVIIAAAGIVARSVVTLILVGVGLSSFAGALMSLLLNFAPHPFFLSDLISWTLGSVANRSFDDILLVLPFLVIGSLVLLATRRGLNALMLGEAGAIGIGLDLARARVWLVVGAGLLTGAAVSLAGAIGFVGIVAPHIVRPFVHHNPAKTVIPSAFLGGLMVVIADILVRVIPTNSELNLGVVAALFGAPAFVWIAMQRQTTYD